MANAGKSTCIGYIYNKTLEQDPGYCFENYIQSLQVQLPSYDCSRDYGYLVDENQNERIKVRSSKTGTSKQVHYKHIDIGGVGFTAIDTPGSAHRRHQRQKGIYYGDIGVFCIEINQLISDDLFMKKDLYASLIATLLLWNKYHGSTIIAITKMDTCEFREEAFRMGCEVLRQICGDEIKISTIIPISVEVRERRGHNIDKSSERMLWFEGDTLHEAISKYSQAQDSCGKDSPLLFYVDKMHKRTVHNGRTWRIKLLQGSINVGDEIVLAPVKIGTNSVAITARVKTLRKDFTEAKEGELDVRQAKDSSFVGVDLSDIRNNARKLKKDDFEVFYTTCGFRKGTQYQSSDKLIFKIGFMLNDKFSLKREMGLLWFGREVPFCIIGREKIQDGFLITVQLKNRHIAIPLNFEGRYQAKELIIRYDNSGYDNPCPYIDAELIKLIEEGGES